MKEQFVDMLESVISHELDHCSKQYVIQNKNLLSEKKPGSMYSDFCANNVFKLQPDSYIYKVCKMFIYAISDDEQQAQITAYANLLKSWSAKMPKYIKKTFENNFQKSVLEIFVDFDRRKNILEHKASCASVIRYVNSNNAHKLITFKNRVDALFELDLNDVENANALHIIGYYIFRHNTIKSIQDIMKDVWKDSPELQQRCKDRIYKFFSKESVQSHLDNRNYTKEDKICLYYVRDWYKDNFKKYRLKIYKQTEHYIDKITQQLNENVLEHPIITRYISEHYEPSHPIKDDWEGFKMEENMSSKEIGNYVLELFSFN